jgi:hypothetical protein
LRWIWRLIEARETPDQSQVERQTTESETEGILSQLLKWPFVEAKDDKMGMGVERRG